MRGLHRVCTLSSNSFTEQRGNMPSTGLQIDLWEGRWLMVELAEDMSSILISHTVLTVTSEISNFSSAKVTLHSQT